MISLWFQYVCICNPNLMWAVCVYGGSWWWASWWKLCPGESECYEAKAADVPAHKTPPTPYSACSVLHHVTSLFAFLKDTCEHRPKVKSQHNSINQQRISACVPNISTIFKTWWLFQWPWLYCSTEPECLVNFFSSYLILPLADFLFIHCKWVCGYALQRKQWSHYYNVQSQTTIWNWMVARGRGRITTAWSNVAH